MPVKTLKEYLNRHHIKYVCISHSPAYTAQEIAESAHVSGKELVKTVIIKVDGKMAMAILPAKFFVDLDMIREAAGAEEVELATEEEFKDRFPDCELGAMPPFGNLYGMDVYAAEKLIEDDEIAFNAGNHTELIQMRYKDFLKLVKPKIVTFSTYDPM